MSTSPGQVPAAGWYPDPTDLSSLRYWDGATWAPPALAPDAKKKRNGCLKAFLIVLALLVLGTVLAIAVVVLASGDSTTSADPIPTSQTFLPITQEAWVEIAKDPDAAKGTAIVVYADITQFDANTGPESFLANTGAVQPSNEFELSTSTFFSGDKTSLIGVSQGDILKISGVVTGAYSYKTLLGGNNTVPSIKISGFEKVGLLPVDSNS